LPGRRSLSSDRRPGPDLTFENEDTVHRVCFQLQVRPDRLEEYKARHRSVWPDMLRALRDTGWHNYSLFLRPDGLLIGYVETPSLEAARSGMAATEVNARWQGEMAEFFVDLGDAKPDTGFLVLEEVFHLEDQLAALADSTAPHDLQPDDTRDH
jgi:L-rhamnose mutarotase